MDFSDEKTKQDSDNIPLNDIVKVINDGILNYQDSEYLDEGSDSIIFRHNNYPIVMRFRKFNSSAETDFDSGKKCTNWLTSELIHSFYQNIIKSSVQSQYLLDTFEIYQSSEPLINFIKENSKDKCPKRRNSCLNLDQRFIVLRDFTRIFGNKKSWSIEIKPKWGFLEKWKNEFGESFGSDICRFCIQRISGIKSSLYNVDKNGIYCPIDLFSNCIDRIKRAINSLFEYPQNNLKVFYEGKALDLSASDPDMIKFIKNTLVEIILNDSNNNISKEDKIFNLFCKTNERFSCCNQNKCTTKRNGGIFTHLQNLQTIDSLGIDKVYDLWISLNRDRKFKINNLLFEYQTSNLHDFDNLDTDTYSMNPSDVAKIRQFLMSMTFRDCSIAINFIFDEVSISDYVDASQLFINGQRVLYSIKLIDLDPKSAINIPFYYHNNLKILNLYRINKDD